MSDRQNLFHADIADNDEFGKLKTREKGETDHAEVFGGAVRIHDAFGGGMPPIGRSSGDESVPPPVGDERVIVRYADLNHDGISEKIRIDPSKTENVTDQTVGVFGTDDQREPVLLWSETVTNVAGWAGRNLSGGTGGSGIFDDLKAAGEPRCPFFGL